MFSKFYKTHGTSKYTHTHTEKWDRRGEELVMKEEIQNLTFSAT